MKTNVWMFFLLFLVYGCSNEKEQWLQRAEACMENDPALHVRLEQCELDKKKRTLCCMIALGLDDIDMMA